MAAKRLEAEEQTSRCQKNRVKLHLEKEDVTLNHLQTNYRRFLHFWDKPIHFEFDEGNDLPLMLMIMSNMYPLKQPATVNCVGAFDLDLTQGDRWDWSWNSGPEPRCFFGFKRRASIGWTKFLKCVASWDNFVKVSSSTFWDVKFCSQG